MAQRVALVTTLLTFVLIAVGVYVKITGSGLGCPDWPLCHGGAVPPGEREAIIEFSHRFVASIVGLLVIATAILAWRYYRHVPAALWSAIIAVPLVGIQGLLGAITVVRELPADIVATHLVTAMLVLSCMGTTVIAMYLEDPERRDRLQTRPSDRDAAMRIARRAVLVIAVLLPLVWIGGYMSESGATTACEGWPLCNGSVVPDSDQNEVVHMTHRYIAGGAVFVIAPLLLAGWQERKRLWWAAPAAVAVGGFYAAQVLVGALNVWLTFPDYLTISHTVLASGLWFSVSAAIVLGLYRPLRATAPGPRSHETREVPA